MTVAIMGQEYTHEVRGKIIGIWSINSAAGDICGYFISAMLIELFSSWVVVSIIGLIQFFLVIFFTFMLLKSHESTEAKPQIKVLEALKLPTVINYCACYACMKLLHMAILIWIPYYMEVKLHINIELEGVLMVLYSVGGVLGSVVSGILSDKVSDRSFVLIIMLLISIPIISLLGFELGTSIYLSFVISFIIGVMIGGGSNLLSAVVAADMCDLETHVEAKSTLTGLVDAFGGIGASLGQFIVFFI
jgi:OPA family sugar phosphate sensor protein UhpC-like MFS transporter